MKPHIEHEKTLRDAGFSHIIGIDEAGMGPLAGPLVVAAVYLDPDTPAALLEQLNDSKKISEKKRERIFKELIANEHVRYRARAVPPKEIDRVNIYQAAQHASAVAAQSLIRSLEATNPHLLVDGNKPLKKIQHQQTPLVDGDGISCSIAAASIIAKVKRDAIMRELHETFPLYGFDRHKGYGTREHMNLLRKHGPCPAHRKTYLSFLNEERD